MYNTAVRSHKSDFAKQLLENQFVEGQRRQQEILDLVSSMVIRDHLVTAGTLNFEWDKGLKVHIRDTANLRVHPHALGQLCDTLGYPRTYVSRLQKGVAGIAKSSCLAKMINDLNWHAGESKLRDRRGDRAKHLCRSVGDELRGFLSRNYKRHLASKPLLRAFVAACMQAGMHPLDSHASPIRVNLQCVLPHVFEPVDGEMVAAGVSWSNSDFGGGRMKVSMFLRRIRGGSSAILGDAISEVHIGPVIEEADLELSSETAAAEIAAQRGAIKDAVREQSSPKAIDNLLTAIRCAHEEKIPWHRLKAELSRVLQKRDIMDIRQCLSDCNAGSVQELPPVEFDDEDDPVATRWWAAAALGQLADRETDSEKRKAIQELAGGYVAPSKKRKAK